VGAGFLVVSLRGTAVIDALAAELVPVDVRSFLGCVIGADIEAEEDRRGDDAADALRTLEFELHRRPRYTRLRAARQ